MNEETERNGLGPKLADRSRSSNLASTQYALSDNLRKVGGVLMLGVFLINAYISLFDRTLAQYNRTHLYANWAIVAIDLVATLILLSKFLQGIRWTIVSGIVWPLVYITSLGIDIEMDLGVPKLWPTPFSSYQYLILGDPAQGWVLWKYTMPTAILLLVLIVALSSISVAYFMRHPKERD